KAQGHGAVGGGVDQQGQGVAVGVSQQVVEVHLLGEAGGGGGVGVVGVHALRGARRLGRQLAHRGKDARPRFEEGRAEVPVVEQLHLRRAGGAVLDHVVDHQPV